MGGEVLYIILLVAYLPKLGRGDCAPPEVVYPCTCEQNNLKCGNINIEELRKVFAAQREHPGDNQLGDIHLTDYRMSYIPSGLLSGLNFFLLSINTSSLVSFHDPQSNLSAFAGVGDKLVILTINYYGHPIENFDWSSLSPLERAFAIWLSGSFTAIRTPFPSLPMLQQLWIHKTSISFVAENAFVGLTGANHISLSGNPIKEYRRNWFPSPALSLTLFRTSDEDITVLPEDYFENMPNLNTVILENVENVPQFKSAVHVTISAGYALTCDCRLKWLLRKRDEGKVEISFTACYRPEHLRRRDVNSLTDEEIC